ncbi:MAG: hypothetical protein GZ091_00630 [Paludibacter sp.]|nr:hypothetical protein [Paludibacter sp.]
MVALKGSNYQPLSLDEIDNFDFVFFQFTSEPNLFKKKKILYAAIAARDLLSKAFIAGFTFRTIPILPTQTVSLLALCSCSIRAVFSLKTRCFDLHRVFFIRCLFTY